MKFKEKCRCMVCGKDMVTYDDARVEWFYDYPYNFSKITSIVLCHHECSKGYNGFKGNMGDWIFNQFCDEEFFYLRLIEMKECNSHLSRDIENIRNQLF